MNNLLFKLLILLAVSVVIPRVYAGAYVQPVSISGQMVTQKIISWDESEGTINPCYGKNTCFVGPDVLYSTHPPGMYGTCSDAGNCLEISKIRTMKEVVQAFNKVHKIPFTATFHIDNESATCVGLFYITHTPSLSIEDAIKWPGSTCGKLPPVNQSCNVSLPSLIDYGSVGLHSLDGKTASITGTVSCSLAGTVRLFGRSATGEKSVFLNSDHSLYATLEINNSSAWDGVDINAPANRVPVPFAFTTILQTSGTVNSGSNEGNAIVLLTYQ